MGVDKRIGKLVWQVGGREIVVLDKLPFPLLNNKRRELLKNPDYRIGKLVIRYLFN